MIEVEHLTKYYGDLAAIKDISFTVKKGEVMGFLGPNGSGKTTTMRILAGYLPPSAGSAHVAGYDVLSNSFEVRRRIGYLPETPSIYPEMSVGSYLDFVARIRGIAGRPTAIARAMEMCDIADHARVLIGKLSKGYYQRVGLAQALIHDPEVLILDEPTIGLDPGQIIEVRELIKALGGDRTIILSTHILPEVSHVCKRVLIINEGRIVAEDTAERLTARLKGTERVYLRLSQPTDSVSEVLRAIEGVTSVKDKGHGLYEVECTPGVNPRAAMADAVVRAGWGLLEMRPGDMSLEEIFLKLTTEEGSV